MSEDYARLKGVFHYNNIDIITELEQNIKHFLNWSFLKIGAWTDVEQGTTAPFGGDYYSLKLVNDPSWGDGRVWQGIRKDWVWESGVDYIYDENTYNPSSVKIYVNGTQYAYNDDTYGYFVDYPNGRVVFNNAIPVNSVVTADYSFRNVQVYTADEAEWWSRLQYDSYRSDDTHWQNSSGVEGEWGLFGTNRVQMPAVVIEAVPRKFSKGYELGNSAMWVNQDILFHVVAENREIRNKLSDILSNQGDRAIWLYDSDEVGMNDAFPLDYRGMLKESPLMYKDLVSESGYRWKKSWLVNPVVSNMISIDQRLHLGTVRITFQLISGNV